jgi:hypothetical protein
MEVMAVDFSSLGRWIFFAGLGLAALGGLMWLAGRIGLPLGRLPGDIRIEREGFSFYFPLATGIVISLVLTLLLNIVGRFLRR